VFSFDLYYDARKHKIKKLKRIVILTNNSLWWILHFVHLKILKL